STDEKAAVARAAGADLVVDYRQPDAAARLRDATGGRGVDRVVELDIAANAALDIAVLRPGGDIVVYGSGQPQFSLPFFPLIANGIGLQFFIVYNLGDEDRHRAQEVLATFLQAGSLQHRIGHQLPLAQIAQAHELVESGKADGNVVLSLDAA
ncbi:MAG TPA: zinc-binding dehydrogenase, partial [Ramlibacter sp.]|nr:zinc-binding dehydrogenase [Ramlibacter sp.]